MARRSAAIGAAVAILGLLWLALAGRGVPPSESVESAAATDPSGPSGPVPAAGRAGAAAPRGARAPLAAAPQQQEPAESSEQVRARLAQRAQAQRAGNDARYAELSQRFPDERRDEPWASARERAFRAVAAQEGLDALLIEVECRRTLCRLELAAADSDTAFALQRARGFGALLGDDSGVSLTGSGRDRALELFVPREASATTAPP